MARIARLAHQLLRTLLCSVLVAAGSYGGNTRHGSVLNRRGTLAAVIDAWSLTNAQDGWLAGMMFAGYMEGVLPLVGGRCLRRKPWHFKLGSRYGGAHRTARRLMGE